MELIERERIQELHLLWPVFDASLLCDVPRLRALTLLDFALEDPTPIECLHDLEFLNFETYSNKRIEFSNFPKLQECYLRWTKGVESVLKLTKLREFRVSSFPKNKINELAKLTDLKDLAILGCSAESLEPIRSLKKLESLSLTRMRKLSDNEFLSSLTQLRSVRISGCSGFGSFEPFRNLTNLESLSLTNCGPFTSLEPLSGLVRLRQFGLHGPRADVLDGDYSHVEELPNLEAFGKR